MAEWVTDMDQDETAAPATEPASEKAQPGRDDILVLARLAGLHLPAAYQDELVEAYGHVRRLVARLPGPRPRADEPAHTFDPLAFRPNHG